MNFVSPVFLLFFPLVLLACRLLPAERRWMPLLGASWFFYAWHSVPLLGLLVLATALSWFCALQMERGRGGWFALGCGVLLGLLFVFKYLDFAANGICALLRALGLDIRFDGFGLVLPMGISFYVFQTLAYLLDVRRGRISAERHFGDYALFVSFFPQLVAGPIERPGALLPQLKHPAENAALTADSWRLLLRGFAKKVMLADCLAGCVDAAYADPIAAGGAALAAATALFAVQIYCDFSGYTDIARGCAGLLGIRLSRNFDRPYAAVTVRDFWRRWHISLTGWFTDYVYIPLGGSRRGTAVQCRNILIVFLLSGLWHGADLTFVLWGALHGLFLIAETLLDRGKQPRHPHLRHGVTLLLVGFAWIFFRADSWDSALLVLKVLCTDWNPAQLLPALGLTVRSALRILGLLMLLPVLEKLPPLRRNSNEGTALLYFLTAAAILFCRALVLSTTGAAAFLYFQF